MTGPQCSKVPGEGRGQKGPGDFLEQPECTKLPSPGRLSGREAPLGSGRHRPQMQRLDVRGGCLCSEREENPVRTLNSRSLLSTRDAVCPDIPSGQDTLWNPQSPSTAGLPRLSLPLSPQLAFTLFSSSPCLPHLCSTHVTWNMAPQLGWVAGRTGAALITCSNSQGTLRLWTRGWLAST